MSNKCPKCGFPEHMNSEFCPVVTDKLYGFTSQQGIITASEPSLRLLVVDLGDLCVVKVEKGTMPQIPPYHRHPPSTFILGVCFSELQHRINEHFAEDKPVPRIEKNPDNDGYKFIVPDMADSWLLPAELKAINALARQAGAARDLEIYEPKGEWTQIYPTGSYNVKMEWVAEENAPIAKIAEVSEYPCKIWRYER